MTRREKQYRTLDNLEKAFLTLLSEATIEASEDPSSLFFHSDYYNPWSELKGRTDSKTNDLVRNAQNIIDLRSQLGEPEKCLALVFLDFCKQYVDISNANRVGVKKHALALLKEIHRETQKKISIFEKRSKNET
jgi:cell division protein FtsL